MTEAMAEVLFLWSVLFVVGLFCGAVAIGTLFNESEDFNETSLVRDGENSDDDIEF